MFSEKQISAYRSIRAPEELKERIFSEAKGKTKRSPHLYRYGAMAAALVFVIALSLFFRSPSSDAALFLNGSELAEQGVFTPVSPASEMRSTPSHEIPFEIKTEGRVVLRVSRGTLAVEGKEGKSELAIQTDCLILWQLPGDSDLSDCYLEMEEKSGATRFLLTFDETEQSFVVRKVS